VIADNPEESAQVIEGGSIVDTDLRRITVKGPFDVEKHRGLLTYCLLGLLLITIGGAYLGIIVMEWNGKKVETLSSAFHVALPVVSGLTGTAFAYYFRK